MFILRVPHSPRKQLNAISTPPRLGTAS